MTYNREPPEVSLKNESMQQLGLVLRPVPPVVRLGRGPRSLEVDEHHVGTLRQPRCPIAPRKGGSPITVDHEHHVHVGRGLQAQGLYVQGKGHTSAFQLENSGPEAAELLSQFRVAGEDE